VKRAPSELSLKVGFRADVTAEQRSSATRMPNPNSYGCRSMSFGAVSVHDCP